MGAGDDNRVKGVAFLNSRDMITELKGAAAWERVLSSLDVEVAGAYRSSTILASGWYPIAWFRNVLRTPQVLGMGDRKLTRHIACVATEDELTRGIYKFFVSVLSPQTILLQASKLFSKYYQRGTVTVNRVGDHGAHAIWSDCVGFDGNVWVDLFGGCEGALRAAGARTVEFRLHAGGEDGCEHADATLTWKVG